LVLLIETVFLWSRYVAVKGAHFGRPAITADKDANAYIVGFLVSDLSNPISQSAAYTIVKKGVGGLHSSMLISYDHAAYTMNQN
jgi:heme-binding NEAT domain protein